MSESRAVYDPLEGERLAAVSRSSAKDQIPDNPPRYLEFYSPSQLCEFQEPEGHNLVGDYHIQRGAIAVLAGAPGVGKSRAALYLAIQGAKGKGDWFGLPVHIQFRTLILQNENGLVRLHRDFEEIKLPTALDSFLRVSSPPPLGMLMHDPLFRAELRAIVADFGPHVFIIDPWNSVVRDAMEKDYQEGFKWLREILAGLAENPACLIVHHLRKPKPEDRARGRGLLNLMAGSYTIFSVPRSAMILRAASDDGEHRDVVVFHVAKNNDGKDGQRSAYERRNGLFVPVEDFDWSAYDASSGGKRKGPAITEEHLQQVFENGDLWLLQKDAADKLEKLTGMRRSTCQDALKVTGRFAAILRRRDDKKIGIVNVDDF